jgi:prepilin-type N-terminal cleavage/methylation domain-containing protein
LRRLLQRLRREHGFTISEMLVAMSIFAIVLGGITGLFTAGIKAESDLNLRFRAQAQLGVALAKMKRDLHAACKQTTTVVTGPTGSITVQMPNGGCVDSVGNSSTQPITWCVRQVGTAIRYQLFRVAGATCTGGTRYGDYVTSPAPFTFYPYNVTASSAPNPCNCYALARLHVDLKVDVDPSRSTGAYRLVNDIAFRNSRDL